MQLTSLSVLLVVLSAGPALAQLVLPGAVVPGTTSGEPPKAKAKPAGFRPAPGIDGVIDKPLFLNGGKAGTLRLAHNAGDLALAAFKLSGDRISKPGEDCSVDLKPEPPIVAKPLGKPAGLLRYEIGLSACQMTFDVLDGAILVPRDAQTCLFRAADCRVDPAGMWGPAGAEFTPERIKELDRERAADAAAELDDFRALAARTLDKQRTKEIAADQAAFSSLREETCRAYVREATHGFCAARFTEAHIAALQNLLGEVDPAPKKHSKKPRGPAAAMAPSGDLVTPN